MKISISDKNNFYPYLNEVGYYGLDVPFEDFDKKEFILSDEYTDIIAKKAESIADAGLKVCQTHLTYYPGHLKPIGNGSYEEFEERLASTGNTYEIELEVKILDENPGKKAAQANYTKIGENVY